MNFQEGSMKQDESYEGLQRLGYEQTKAALLKLKQSRYGNVWAFINGMQLAIDAFPTPVVRRVENSEGADA
jgi:hypothetical protein